jgi:hypothetical protein
MAQIAHTTAQFLQWIRNTYADQYARSVNEVSPGLVNVMERDVPSDKLIEYYGYFLAAPHMKLWRRGENISYDSFDSVSWSVQNYDWGMAVDWHMNDRIFDQTKSLMDRIKDVGRSAVRLHERIFFQYLQGQTDNDLMPFVPNAPDGAAFFATTAGGANRFGVSSGNLMTGTGVATAAAIRTDLWNAVEQFRLMQDGKGQPFWNPGIIDQGITVIYGAGNSQVFAEAFQQKLTQGSSAGVSNIILDADLKVTLWPTFYIGDNDWYVFLNGAPKKPVFHQAAIGLQEFYENVDNSERARNTKLESYKVMATWGYGLALPIGAVKVNN